MSQASEPEEPLPPPGTVFPRPARMSERRTSLIAALLVAIGPVSLALYTPAMPELVAAFGTTTAAITLTLTFYFAGFAFAQLIAGPLSDAFGRRRATIAFLAVYLVGSVLAAFAGTVETLLAARLVQGIGAAVGVTVARAIVRDQFEGEQAARIMNTVGIMLAIAPAISPALGGFTLVAAGWQALFILMIGFGAVSIAVVWVSMAETTQPSPMLARPRMVVSAYRAVITNGEFLTASLVVGSSVGVFYAQATILPFVMIERVGLSPTGFGLSMLMQSGAFFLGAMTMRALMRRHPAAALVMPGLAFIAGGSILLLGGLWLAGPSFLTVMGPVAFAAFGVAFVMPHMQMAGLIPFPHIAGSASAMMGFIQMGSGLLAGTAAALIDDPVTGLAIVVPAMALIGVGGHLWHRAIAKVRIGKARRGKEGAPAE